MSDTKSNKIETHEQDTVTQISQDECEEDEIEIESTEAAEIENREALESARQEAKENYDRLLRVSAEFENFKKRAAKEQSEFKKYANESLLKDLLQVVDNLERAIASASNGSKDVSTFIEGVELTLKEILKILKKYHVNPIESIGNSFDPCFQQAVMQTESSDHPANTITEELQKGYLIHDRLLRPAMVVVSKSPNTAEDI